MGYYPVLKAATGGTVTESGGYRIHAFLSDGTFTARKSMNVEVLVVAGGGGGGEVNSQGGGGGAGGLIFHPSFAVVAGSTYSSVIGGGGKADTTGTDTTFSTLTAKGGGGGKSYGVDGAAGGSGGGGGVGAPGVPRAGGAATQSAQGGDSGTYGFGYAGGNGGNNNGYAGGGGGAGGLGGNANTPTGGIGKDYSAQFGTGFGVSGVFSIGGYGCTPNTAGKSSGGGANTGGGGFGAWGGAADSGGSGIVLIRYLLTNDDYVIFDHDYRKKITVTTTTATPALYQVMITVPYATGMNADFSDLRFVTKTGTSLDFWLESKTDSTTANIWVELEDAIGASSLDYIYMRYGNPDLTSASSGANTFIVWDNFVGGTEQWTETDAGGKLSIDRTTNYRIDITALPNTLANEKIVLMASSPISDFVYDFKILRTESTAGTGLSVGIADTNVDRVSTGLTNAVCMLFHGNGVLYLEGFYSGTRAADFVTSAWSINTVYYGRLTRLGDVLNIYLYSDSTRLTLISSKSITQAGISNSLSYVYAVSNIGDTANTVTGWISDIHIRKFIATEPTYSIGSPEAMDTFTRRRRLSINNNSGGALTAYQIPLTVPSKIAMQTDFDDVRFIDVANGLVLPYWIETKTDSSTATLWLKADLPNYGAGSAGDNIFYMYYGNPDLTSVSNGTNVFTDFEDFTSVADWTAEADVSIVSDSTTWGSAIYSGKYTGGSNWNEVYRTVATKTGNFISEFEIKVPTSTVGDRFWALEKVGGTYDNGINLVYQPADGYLNSYDGSTLTHLQAISENTIYKIKVVGYPASSTADFFVDNVSRGTGLAARGSISEVTAISMFGNTAGNTWIAQFRTRLYIATEPTTFLGREEPQKVRIIVYG